MMKNGKIGALILAAGCSSRMGALKPLLRIGPATLLEMAVTLFRKAGIQDVHVVVGHRAEEIIPFLDRLKVKWVFNEHYDRGMLSSILAGVQSFDPHVEAFCLLPVDIPLVKPKTINELVGAYRNGQAKVIYPCFRKKRGHPPIISTICMRGELAWDHPGGLKNFLERFDEEAQDVEVRDEAILMNCNTPQDLRVLEDSYLRGDIPTIQECEALWERFDVSENVRAHSRMVAELARILAVYLNRVGLNLDLDLVVAAGFLHDLAKGQKDHAATGAKILKEMGYRRVGEIVALHMDLGSPKQFLDESDLIYLADKCVENDRLLSLEDRFQRPLARYVEGDEIRKAVMKRLEDGKAVRKRIEHLLGISFDRIIERYERGIRAASARGRREIYLVRHGAIRLPGRGKQYIGQLDLCLSEEGFGQAQNLAERLSHIQLAGIYCSDLARSVKTAEIIGKPHGLEPVKLSNFREIYLGEWEGLSFDEVCCKYPEEYEKRGRDVVHYRPPYGESFLDCSCRVISSFYEALQSTRGNILIVGHAGVNRIILCQAMGKSLESLFEIHQDYGCLNVIECKDFGFEVKTLNETVMRDPL